MANLSHNFIFVDESGDPGKPYHIDSNGNKTPTGASTYYILSALVVNSAELYILEEEILKTKIKFGYKKEIKSTDVSLGLYEALLRILNQLEIKSYYRCVNKLTYKGVFAVDGNKKLHNVFDEYNLVKLVSFVIKDKQILNTEVVIDRADRRLLDGKFENCDNYLMSKINTKTLKKVGCVTHVNSEYVNAMQMTDLISGAIKESFTKRNGNLKKVIDRKLLKKIW